MGNSRIAATTVIFECCIEHSERAGIQSVNVPLAVAGELADLYPTLILCLFAAVLIASTGSLKPWRRAIPAGIAGTSTGYATDNRQI